MKSKTSFHKMAYVCTALSLYSISASHAGVFVTGSLTGDANSGISVGTTYTAKADFIGTGLRSINGVAFPDTGLTGTGYSLTGTNNSFTGFTSNVTGSIGAAISDFRFGETNNLATLTLSGLTVGTTYRTSFFGAGFGAVGGRIVNITASDTATTTAFDQNGSGASNGNVLRYTFTATAATIDYRFVAQTTTDTFHHYITTNEVVPEPSSMMLFGMGALGLAATRRRK